jgi:hypothetical protein
MVASTGSPADSSKINRHSVAIQPQLSRYSPAALRVTPHCSRESPAQLLSQHRKALVRLGFSPSSLALLRRFCDTPDTEKRPEIPERIVRPFYGPGV